MDIYPPKNLGKTIEVKASNRPIKIAYIVPFEESSVNHMLIDAVFYESYTRWTGIYTLIVPSSSKEFLDPAYESWFEFFDPDFVCTYIELGEDTIKKIDKLCSPITLIQHQIRRPDSDDLRWSSFIQDWHRYFTPVSSITTLPSPHLSYPFGLREEPESEITVITQYYDSLHRLLRDNFGTAFDLHTITHAIPGFFKTLCLVPSQSRRSYRSGYQEMYFDYRRALCD